MPAQKLLPYRLEAVEKLIPYARNARTHSDAQVAQIAASIREFGFTTPVLVDGDKSIIAGHGRVLAARMLELDKVPVIELGHLSEAQKRAYILADNRIALNAGWDEDLLKIELTELRDDSFDLSLLGFGGDELDRLLAEAPPDAPFGDTADEPGPPEDFPSYNEQIDTEHECPKCGYRFSGGKRIAREGGEG